MKGRVCGGVGGSTATSWLVAGVWWFLSVAVAGASLVSLVQPAWFVRREKVGGREVDAFMFGAFSFCFRLDATDDYRCHVYGGVLDSRRAPSGAWQVSGLLYGGGCVLLACCALAALLAAALPTSQLRHQAAFAIGITQAVAVTLLLMALFLFPVGLGSIFVRHHCGDGASAFDSGSCQMGWSYTLALVAAILAIYCPLLANLTTYKIYDNSEQISCYYWTNTYSIL